MLSQSDPYPGHRPSRSIVIAAAVWMSIAASCGTPPPSRTPPPPEAPPETTVVTDSHRCGYILDKLYFAVDATELAPHQLPTLDAMASLFRCQVGQCRFARLRVEGHASLGESDPGALALARADAVRDALVARQVPASMQTTIGFSANRPVEKRETEDALAKNRRVEFTLDVNGCGDR